MIIFKYIKNNLKIIRSDFAKMTTIKELVDYITFTKVRSFALLLCLIWISSPVYILLRSTFLNNHDAIYYSINRFDLGVLWFILLQQIGLLGCLLAILLILKNLVCIKEINNQRKYLIYNHYSVVFLIFLLIWTILSTIFSNNIILSINGTAYRRDGLISYIAYAGLFSCGYILNDKYYFKKVLRWFMWTSSFLALLMLLDIEYINRLLTFHPNSAIFYNINHFAYYLCMAIMSAVAIYMMETDSEPQRKQYMLCFIVLVAALVKNKSFGPYFAVVAGLIFTLIVIRLYNRKHIKDIVKITIIFVITSFIMNLFYGVIGAEIIKLFSGINDIIQESETAVKAGSGRWEIWTHGLNLL